MMGFYGDDLVFGYWRWIWYGPGFRIYKPFFLLFRAIFVALMIVAVAMRDAWVQAKFDSTLDKPYDPVTN